MFDQFPVEIQYMIYNLVFIHVDAIKTCRARQTSLPNEVLPSPISISRSELSLLSINRYVRSVALPFFWRENAFCFDASSHSDIRVCNRQLPIAVLLEWLIVTMTASDPLSLFPKTQYSLPASADYGRSIIRNAQARRVGRGLVRTASSAEQDQRACMG